MDFQVGCSCVFVPTTSVGSHRETLEHALMPGFRVDLASDQQQDQDLLIGRHWERCQSPTDRCRPGRCGVTGGLEPAHGSAQLGLVESTIIGKGATRIMLSAQILRIQPSECRDARNSPRPRCIESRAQFHCKIVRWMLLVQY